MDTPHLGAGLVLLCRVGSRFCALPVEHVEETLRPLPLKPLAGMPPFVLGLAIIRGTATPVIHAGTLLGAEDAGTSGHWLSLRIGERRVALAVDAVIDVRDLSLLVLENLPPLLHGASAEVVEAIGTLDSSLLLLLRSSRVASESVWTALESAAPGAIAR